MCSTSYSSYLQRAHLRSWLLEWLPVGLSCQHPMMCPVQGVGTFLGDASTCPGCASFPSSQQSSCAAQRALRHLLWSLLHKQWGLASKTFDGPSNTVPSTFCKDQPSSEDTYRPPNNNKQDFAHSKALQDPLPSPMGLCPIKSPSPSCTNTSQHGAWHSVETRTTNCLWACEGRARQSCPRLRQHDSECHIRFRCLTVKEILEIESAVENFKQLGFF